METLDELKAAVLERDALFRIFLAECIKAGMVAGMEDYAYSPEFEEEASDYCREQGWKEPE